MTAHKANLYPQGNQRVMNSKAEDALLSSRRASSMSKKGLFNEQEVRPLQAN
mgnify:FL=1